MQYLTSLKVGNKFFFNAHSDENLTDSQHAQQQLYQKDKEAWV